jgi:hypothetical protein
LSGSNLPQSCKEAKRRETKPLERLLKKNRRTRELFKVSGIKRFSFNTSNTSKLGENYEKTSAFVSCHRAHEPFDFGAGKTFETHADTH